jgi:hypothetical protein
VVFDFAPHFFNRVEVGRIGRKEERLGARLRDQGEGELALVRREIVHDDDIAGTQDGLQHTAHVSPEHFGIGGAINRHAGGGAIQPDRADHGGGLPMPMRRTGMNTRSAQGTPPETGHVGLGPRFIEKDQPCRVKAGLVPPPRPTRPRDVGPVLFAGAECLFLYVSPRATSA